jgi:hypothetical protein
MRAPAVVAVKWRCDNRDAGMPAARIDPSVEMQLIVIDLVIVTVPEIARIDAVDFTHRRSLGNRFPKVLQGTVRLHGMAS